MGEFEPGPIFVLTTHRSGGTALTRAMNSHPQIVIWGEHGGWINKLAEANAVINRCPALHTPLDERKLDEYVAGPIDEFSPWTSPFDAKAFGDWARALILDSFRKGLHPNQRWGFKEIRYHSLLTARFLLDMFPSGRFVILRRDLTSLVRSNLLCAWSVRRLVEMDAASNDDELKRAVDDCAYAILAIDHGFGCIAATFPDRTFEIDYGALLAQPGETLADLGDFALLSGLRELGAPCLGKYLGNTDLRIATTYLPVEKIDAMIPDSIVTAGAAIERDGLDLARLKRLHDGRYSLLVGDHELAGTMLSGVF